MYGKYDKTYQRCCLFSAQAADEIWSSGQQRGKRYGVASHQDNLSGGQGVRHRQAHHPTIGSHLQGGAVQVLRRDDLRSRGTI